MKIKKLLLHTVKLSAVVITNLEQYALKAATLLFFEHFLTKKDLTKQSLLHYTISRLVHDFIIDRDITDCRTSSVRPCTYNVTQVISISADQIIKG